MSEAQLISATRDADARQDRILALSREALEGRRPLSELLGEALYELRASLSVIRQMEAELRRRDGSAAADPADGRARRAVTAGSWEAGDGAAADGRPEAVILPASLDLFARPIPGDAPALEASLRARIAGGLYVGTLRAGDRLPSIRELARLTGLNHKVVRSVYRRLERGGLIEVRDRSGIYLAQPAPPAAGDLDDQEAWIASVVEEGVRRGVLPGDLLPLVRRSVAARPLSCACVDSTEDDRFALCLEIEQRFGLRTSPVHPNGDGLAAALEAADLVVTTPFHADEVRRALPAERPLVVAQLDSSLRRTTTESAPAGPVLLVCVDTAAGNRLRHSLGPDAARRMRVVAVEALDPTRDGDGPAAVVATHAARLRMDGARTLPGLTVFPYLSASTQRQLARFLVGLNRDPAAEA
jgi:DNA-binding transcriptional regulator YhcF (GntR family)